MKLFSKFSRIGLCSFAVVAALAVTAALITQQSKSGIAIEDLALVQDELRPVSLKASPNNVYLDAYGNVHAAPVDLGSAYLDAYGNVHAAPVDLSNNAPSLFRGRNLPKPQRAE